MRHFSNTYIASGVTVKTHSYITEEVYTSDAGDRKCCKYRTYRKMQIVRCVEYFSVLLCIIGKQVTIWRTAPTKP